MLSAWQALSFLLVGAFWGCTNPFLKSGSKGVEQLKTDSVTPKWLSEIFFLLTRWQYVVPFAINQCGSLVYYLSLGDADISMAVPIANSTTFMWTALTQVALGEEAGNRYTLIGSVLVVVGVGLCVCSKLEDPSAAPMAEGIK
mmetsp:Transcript_13590/g.31529  ORF Transcript_13590/g.31529 Transcript_13590/m.31529 type:complete len:143 (-) Transcript_13590:133-561(-)